MKLVGYTKFNSKDGNACCFLQVIDDFQPSARSKMGAVGQSVQQIYVENLDLQKKITPECIGKNITISYGKDGRNFFVNQITIF